MDKKAINTFIRKYHLNGTLEQVRWLAKNGQLNVTAITSDKKFLTSVTLDKFDGFEDAEVGILETSRLKQMMTAIGDNVTFTLNKDDEDRVTSMVLSDDKTEVQYVAADLDVLPARPKTKSLPDYGVEIKLTETFIDKFLKAKAALPEVDLFTLVMSKKKGKMEMVLGYSDNINNNRIALEVDASTGEHRVVRNSDLMTLQLVGGIQDPPPHKTSISVRRTHRCSAGVLFAHGNDRDLGPGSQHAAAYATREFLYLQAQNRSACGRKHLWANSHGTGRRRDRLDIVSREDLCRGRLGPCPV